MPWVRLSKVEGEPSRALGWLLGDGYPAGDAASEIRTWLTPDDTLVVQLYWHVYQPGVGGERQGEAVLHKDSAGFWHGVVPELLGQWSVRSKFPGKYGVLLFGDNEEQVVEMAKVPLADLAGRVA